MDIGRSAAQSSLVRHPTITLRKRGHLPRSSVPLTCPHSNAPPSPICPLVKAHTKLPILDEYPYLTVICISVARCECSPLRDTAMQQWCSGKFGADGTLGGSSFPSLLSPPFHSPPLPSFPLPLPSTPFP